ncbi:hypothetical protein OAA40_00465 [bacterium]|nr:hypothetical protein [bacterium]MDB4346182.1 hypothetical protein [bacterium]
MKPKHSKYKNTGILFELLTRQITSETISNSEPKAVGILRKFFSNNSTLLKEYQIYHALLNKKFEKEASATVLIETLINAHYKLNKSLLRRERYNLVREIKETYNIEDFFKAKVPNYKVYASVYNLLENQNANLMSVVNSKVAILEHITNKNLPNKPKKEMVMEEYEKFDKETRALTHKMLMEKFNEKYSGLAENQKTLLKEYVYSVSNNPKLKAFINKEIIAVKAELETLAPKTDQVTQIKLNEVKNLIKPLCKKSSVHDDNVINLLNYYGLVNELKATQK